MEQLIEQITEPTIDVEKTVQAAAYFLSLSEGKLEYMKLVKLLYNCDREALRRWFAPITYDVPYAMPHGMVPTATLDLAEDQQPRDTVWGAHIERDGRWDNVLRNDPGISRLSEAETELMREMYKKYEEMNGTEMGEEHHRPELFPEWIDPNGSSTYIGIESVLKAMGLDEEDIEIILIGLEGKTILDMMA